MLSKTTIVSLVWHMEVPRLGAEVELLAYTTATATPDPSCVCDLHQSSRQRQILNPLNEARERTHNLMVPSWIHFHCAMTGTPGNLEKESQGRISLLVVKYLLLEFFFKYSVNIRIAR